MRRTDTQLSRERRLSASTPPCPPPATQVRDLQIEIITRGPIACMVDPRPLNSYKEGVIDAEWDAQVGYAHVLEVVGWG